MARCTASVVLPAPPLRATTAIVCITPAPMLKSCSGTELESIRRLAISQPDLYWSATPIDGCQKTDVIAIPSTPEFSAPSNPLARNGSTSILDKKNQVILDRRVKG